MSEEKVRAKVSWVVLKKLRQRELREREREGEEDAPQGGVRRNFIVQSHSRPLQDCLLPLTERFILVVVAEQKAEDDSHDALLVPKQLVQSVAAHPQRRRWVL